MRLLDLQLRAFGPFTGRQLDLSGGEQGLHVVYGPNEAGKSSALRALKALLFGFPPRSTDGFLHPYDQLRVGGRLRLADGTEVAFVRRKGTKATVLSAEDDSPLDAGFLDRCLQGVEERHFSTLFGIDHDALVRGGRELLEQHGEVGQALFSAGLGTQSLRPVLESLEREADGLFLARGTRKPLITQLLAEHREAKKELADANLNGRELEGDRKELERLRQEADELVRDIAALGQERSRLQRLRRALPLLAERRHLAARLAELDGTRVLPPDFAGRRREVQDALRAARESGSRAAAELAGLKEEAAGLTVDTAVLAQAETLDRLHQGVGRYAKDLADRSRLLGESGEVRARAAELLDELRPGLTLEEAETLRPALARWMRIQELGNQRQARVNALEQARRAAEEAARALAAAREERARLAAPRDPSGLRRRAEAARRAGDLDEMRAQAAAHLETGSGQLQLDLRRLGLWSGTPEELEALALPPPETIERFGRDLDAVAERRRSLEERRQNVRAEQADLDRRLAELRRAGAVPSETDLLAARQQRDERWRRLRTRWEDAEADAYEEGVAAADDLADRLRREADRVQLQAQLSARRDQLAAESADLDARLAAAAAESTTLEAGWRELWAPCGLVPRSPREMHPAWTSRAEKLRQRAQETRGLRRRLDELDEARRRHRAVLAAALEDLGEPATGAAGAAEELEPLLAQAEEAVRRLEEEGRRRARLEEEVRQAEVREAAAVRDREAAVAALDEWSRDWAVAIQDLGVGADALPSEVTQIVDRLRRIFAGRQESEKIERRIAGLTRDLESFQDAVRALAAELAPDRVQQPPDQTAVFLHALLQEARRRADRREALDRRIARLEREVREAETTRRAMEERLAELRREAGCADSEGLEEAERRSAEVRGLRGRLADFEKQLLSEGVDLEVLEREAEGVDPDTLASGIDQVQRDIEEREPRLGDLREEIGRRAQELEQRTGGEAGDRAARAAERAEEVLARLRAGVDRYVRLRLGELLLRRQIERYRAENQAPLLRRAGEIFTTLTLGRFAGLHTDFEERGGGDEPVLVGVRAAGGRVRVEAMSEGTRDQLYLALRLATLEKYLAHAEPLPFVVDDILINFDDQRSAATLRVLAELSRKTQVILFTHHERLKEMAGAMGDGTGVFVRELG